MQISKLTWDLKPFRDLTTLELHDLLKVRVDVFIVEQDCPYNEIDGLDLISWHILGKNSDNRTLATTRIVPARSALPEVSIGRVAISKSFRGKGYGILLMQTGIDFCIDKLKAETIKISAQLYLKKFYSNLGFDQFSDVYLLDGIEHIDMRYFSNPIGD